VEWQLLKPQHFGVEIFQFPMKHLESEKNCRGFCWRYQGAAGITHFTRLYSVGVGGLKIVEIFCSRSDARFKQKIQDAKEVLYPAIFSVCISCAQSIQTPALDLRNHA